MLSVWVGIPVLIGEFRSSSKRGFSSIGSWDVTVSRSKRSVADGIVVEEVELSEAAALGLASGGGVSLRKRLVVVVEAVDHVIRLDQLAGVGF